MTKSPTIVRARLRRTGGRLFKNMLFLLLLFGLVLSTESSASQTAHHTGVVTAPGGRAEHELRLTHTLSAISEARKAINRVEFDTEALLESLDYDPEAVIEFVRNEIRFEPYVGLLRGTHGTLMSRAGNALDQSLLLTVLLLETGVDARLAHGRLDEQQAMQLVQSLRGQARRVPARDLSELGGHLRRIALASTGDDEALADAIVKSIGEAAGAPQDFPLAEAADTGRDYLQSHLSRADIVLEPADAEPALAKQSTDYYWVEYKDGAAAPWQRIHAVRAADIFDEDSLLVQGYLSDEIPSHLQHRFRLTAKLERVVGGKTEIVELMQPWERPVANMTGVRLTFSNKPNGIRSLHDLHDLSVVEAHTTFLVPTLNGIPAPGAKAFDLRGQAIALSSLQMDSFGAAAVFQTAGDKTLDAVDALMGLNIGGQEREAGTQAMRLRRVWLEYVSIHPSGAERVDERTIWQEPATMSSAAPSILWELATPHGIGIATSEYPASYLVDRELARLLSLEPLLRWAVAAQHVTSEASMPPQPDLDPDRLSFPELSFLTQFDAGVDPLADTSLAYRAEPTIVVTRHGLRNTQGDATSYADVDIVHNRRTVLRTDAAVVQTDPLQAVRQGTWETLIEQVELEKRQPYLLARPPDTIISANHMYQEPHRARQLPMILRSIDDLATLPVDRADRSTLWALEQDLRRGYVVLLEAEPDPRSFVWWRVDPVTGETLGRALDGRGQAVTEFSVTLTVATFTASTIAGTGMCYGASNGCSLAKCLITAAVVSGVGAAGAAAGGAAAGALAGGTAVLGLRNVVGLGFAIGVGALLMIAAQPVTSALPVSVPSCFW